MDPVLIIGYGEIGKAIEQLEEDLDNPVQTLDPYQNRFSREEYFSVIHVCIPYSDKFVGIIQGYLDHFHWDICFIHSTVKVGTCRKLKKQRNSQSLVHSPVRGKHPNLYKSLTWFTKYVGGEEIDCDKALKYLRKFDIRCKRLGDFEATELAKLLSTAYYGWNISFAERAQKLCDKYGQDYDEVMKEWNITYNRGYEGMGMKWVCRPVLHAPEGGIGGHCVYENCDLLGEKGIKKEVQRLGKKK